jgi:tetratricopeptide (TPR) repeat protein
VTIAQPSQLLPPETTIAQVFDQCSGRLLILGEPGAGKTTSLLDLALELVARAEADPQQRIPVVVDLSDWQPTAPQATSMWGRVASRRAGFSQKNHRDDRPEQLPAWSIADWLAAKVREKYGFTPQQIGQWLEEKQLVPLLDGLDEVRPEYQQKCVKAINEWLNSSDLRPRQLALCCRREQYEAYPEKLELEGAVYLQDLTDEQIQTFLQKANRSELSESLVADPNLLALIRRPLLLSIAVLAYGELDPIELQRATSANARLNLLLDAYVQRMLMQDTDSRFYRKGKIPNSRQTQKWLGILAWQLEQDSKIDFSIEEMQPSWLLTRRQQWIYVSIIVLISGFTNGLLVGLIAGISGGLIASLFSGIVAGFLAMEDIKLVDMIQVFISSYEQMKLLYKRLIDELINDVFSSVISVIKVIFVALIVALIGALIGALTGALTGVLTGALTGSWLFGLSFGLFFGAFLVPAILLTELIRIIAKKSAFPNQEIRSSIQNSVLFTLFWVLSSLLILDWLWYWHEQSLWFYFTFLGAYCGLLVVGSLLPFRNTCVQHSVLHLVLFFAGLIPGNYARFLNYATERLLFQRVGRRYKFVHDLFKQFFINQWMDTQPSINRPQAIAHRGYTYRLMERYQEALQDFDRAIELNPKYTWAITNRGETYGLMERYQEALQDFDRAIKLKPKYYWAIANRGYIYRLMERYQEALQDFDHAIEYNPKYTWAITNRGETYRLMERYQEALQDFDRAIELDPKYQWAITHRVYTYLLLVHQNEALRDLDRVIELDSKDDWYQYLRAITYLARNQSNAAKADLDIALHLAHQKYINKPANCQNTFNLALYHLVAGNLSTAREFYQIALQHNASPAKIRDALQDLEDLLKVLGDVPDAKQMIEELKQHLK